MITTQTQLVNFVRATAKSINCPAVITQDGKMGVLMGYRGTTVEQCKRVIEHAVKQFPTANINWDNLFTTDGSSDTMVTIATEQNEFHIVTCYGQ